MKRVTIATALIVAVALLALNKEKWLPQAKDAANVLGAERGQARGAASADRAPRSDRGGARADPVSPPADHRADPGQEPGRAGAGRGLPARAPGRRDAPGRRSPTNVAAEIDNLTAAAAAGLDPAEGEQLRGYLAALRAGTPTAAYQDKEAVWLMARGARRLPAERLARMEELFAQAVTVALPPPVQP